MNSNKSLRIILGGMLPVLVAGVLRWGFFRTDSTASRPGEPAGTGAIVDTDAPVSVSPPQSGVRFQPVSRSAFVRTTSKPAPPAAQQLYVEWKGTWYAAEILDSSNGSNYIRYSGFGAEWDEWVGPDRFKVFSEDAAWSSAPPATLTTEVRALETVTVPEPQHDFAPLVQGRPAQGDLLVEWNAKWWPAEIVVQEGASYFIHYKNYGTNWDEWVTLDRLGVYSGAE